MKIYITRHGQVKETADYYGDALFPKGEVPLSEMGYAQAVCLGKRLKTLHFKGKIFSSPFWRTMETAEIVAEQTGSEIIPIPDLHEIFKTKEAGEEYRGSALEKLKEMYSHISEKAEMSFPWWVPEEESYEMVCKRVADVMDELMKETEDFLIVGHGASTSAVLDYLKIHREIHYLWNCSLTLYDTEHKERGYVNSTGHLPYEMLSNNKMVLKEKSYQINLPEALKAEKGIVLLHIGDTHSVTYPWYRALIEQLRPDIIVHTGDMADEVKVGRVTDAKEEYCDRLKVLLHILKDSKSKVYLVPGNNDLKEKIESYAPYAEVLEPDTVKDIENHRICFSHEKCHISKEAEIYLYGHSERNEKWSPEKNTPESDVWYLNSLWRVFIINLSTRTLYCLDRPEYAEHIWPDKRG